MIDIGIERIFKDPGCASVQSWTRNGALGVYLWFLVSIKTRIFDIKSIHVLFSNVFLLGTIYTLPRLNYTAF